MRRPQTSWLAYLLVLSIVVSLAAAALAEDSPSLLDQAAAAAAAPKNVRLMVEQLMQATDEDTEGHARGVLYEITPLGDAVAVELGAILADLDADPADRARAAAALADMIRPARSQVDALVAAMTDDDIAIRRHAVDAIETMAMRYRSNIAPEQARTIAPLAARATDTEEDRDIREMAMWGLGYLAQSASPVAVAAFVEVAQGDDEELAESAIWLLTWYGQAAAEARGPLLELLETASDESKASIIDSLLDIGAEPDVVATELRALLSSEDASTRLDALATLEWRSAIHEFVGDVVALLGDSDKKVRSTALSCLQNWQVSPLPPETVELLVNYMLAVPRGRLERYDRYYRDDEDWADDEDDDYLIEDPDLSGWAEKNTSEMVEMLYVQAGRRGWPAIQRVYADGNAAARLAVIKSVSDHAYENLYCFDGINVTQPFGRLMMLALDDDINEIRGAAALWLAWYRFLPDDRLSAMVDQMDSFSGRETVRSGGDWGGDSVWERPGPQIVQALHLALTDDSQTDVRLAAVELCGKNQWLPEQLATDLAAMVEAGPHELAWAAADAFLQQHALPPQSVEPLLDLLAQGVVGPTEIDVTTYRGPLLKPGWHALATALIAAGHADAVLETLEEVLTDDDVYWRLQALAVLAALPGDDEPQGLSDLRSRAPAELMALLDSPDPLVRSAAVKITESLGATDQAVDILLAALEDTSDDVRCLAARALWDVGPGDPDRVIPAMMKVIGDPAAGVNFRWRARVALGRCKPGTDILPDLLRIALDDGHPGAWSAAAVWGRIYREARQAEADKQ